jgi:glutaminyl-tRNA synthetase
VFNKIVGLKDSWAKKTKTEDKPVEKVVIKEEVKKEAVQGVEQEMSESQKALFEKYTNNLGLNNEVSNILARDEALSKFYEEALAELNSPITIANIVANDVAKELKHQIN